MDKKKGIMAKTKKSDGVFVSVVVPTCNRSSMIKRCLEALASQDYELFEVIVVDDGSTDDTVEVLDVLQKKHTHLDFKFLVNEKNMGANPSRNRGIVESKGEIVALLDDDSMAESEWVGEIAASFKDEEVAAVTGLVEDPKPSNIWELALKGTHRISDKAGPAHRLVGCNMAFRKDLLLAHMFDEDYGYKDRKETGKTPDVSVSGRSDEEGIYLKLKAAGCKIMTQPMAKVYHEHFHNRSSFFRQAYRGGRSAARLVYKFHLPHRVDMIPFMAAYGSAPLALAMPLMLPLPVLFFSCGIAAITYNDLFRKRKTPVETVKSFPALFGYYQARLYGYVRQTAALHLKPNQIKRIRLKENKK